MEHYIKNVVLKPAHGGYIICCDKHQKTDGEYEGMRYVGEYKIVVEDSSEAISMVDTLFAASVEGSMVDLPMPSSSHGTGENKGTNLLEHK